MASLKDKTITGFFWSFLEKVGGNGIQFIVLIILARLLTPEMFGLLGMIVIFIELSRVIVESGFVQALIQKKDADEEHFSSVFWLNLAMSVTIYLILYVCAPFISVFFKQDILTNLIRVYGLVFIINAFAYVQQARLLKEMKYKRLMIINIPSTIFGGLVSIGMALMDYGVWSLIGLQLATRLGFTIQIWLYSKWKPQFLFNKAKAKELFSFGVNIMLTMVVRKIVNNSYLVVIGKFFPLEMVGYYQNADRLVTKPASTLSSALKSVTYSAFSIVQDDNRKLRTGYRKTIQQTMFWMAPLFVFTGVLAKPLFVVVLGEKWLPSVPLYQILCIVGIVYPLNSFNLNILNVKGRSDLYLKVELLKRLITILGVAVVIIAKLNIWYLVGFQSMSMIINYFINSYYSGDFISYSYKEQLKDIFPTLLIAVLIGTGMFLIDQFILIDNTYILRLLIGFSMGITLYWALTRHFSIGAYIDFKNIFQKKFNKWKKTYE